MTEKYKKMYRQIVSRSEQKPVLTENEFVLYMLTKDLESVIYGLGTFTEKSKTEYKDRYRALLKSKKDLENKINIAKHLLY